MNPEVNNEICIVTCLYDLRRDSLSDSFKRTFEEYKDKFKDLLKCPNNIFIYCSKDLESFIWEHRTRYNTVVKIMELDDFKTWFPFYNEVQSLISRPEWYQQAEWLEQSPQAKLPDYNPLVMSKMFMLNDAAISNSFNSEYYCWLDAGIANTVHPGYFYHDLVLNNMPSYLSNLDKFLFVSYPYIGGYEIHGFPREKMAEFCSTEYVEYVCRGGFFGGRKSHIHSLNSLYYEVLQNTLSEGYIGTEESIFTIMAHIQSESIHRFIIEDNGLIWPIFEELKDINSLNDKYIPKFKNIDKIVTNLYVLTYNSPKQFETLIKSFNDVDSNFITKPNKYLINNSTDNSTQDEYNILCKYHNFVEIKKDNIGICGGRQLAADHFDKSEADYYIFFEDDMNLNKNITTDSRGFTTYINNLFNTTLNIINSEQYDYLKLSFCEFYGDNSVQWSWYNISDKLRLKYFPDHRKLPKYGLSKNPPNTVFTNIKTRDRISYIEGEIYYCNWPIWFSRKGNNKIFIEDMDGPQHEQVMMSRAFQLHKDKRLNTAVLLSSPVDHDRFDFYSPENRKEL